jgi:cytochrome c-type protein NapC
MTPFRAMLAACIFSAVPIQVAAIDWAKVGGKDIVLLYPAQLSWEMLLTQAEHSGADKFCEGRTCRQCHEGEESNSGSLLVGDKKSEPHPIPGKPGSLPAVIKAAHDGETLFLRIEFAPGNQPDAGLDKEFDTKVTVMFDDGKVNETANGGCWVTCHDNMAKMPSGAEGDTTKYLMRSRVKMARTGGAEIKPAEDLQKLRDAGQVLEFWEAKLNPGAPAVVVDGTVLEKRAQNPAALATGEAAFADGKWSVTLARKMAAPAPYKPFAAGTTYTLGFAVHAGHTAQRFHYVSLEKTLVLDSGKADLVAKKQ